jgi:hypothetical protein
MKTYLNIELPKNFMNVGVTNNNELVADTNNSAEWDTLKFPLPKGKWRIHSYKADLERENVKTILKLIDTRSWIRRFLEI